jgi:hypothetical protein
MKIKIFKKERNVVTRNSQHRNNNSTTIVPSATKQRHRLKNLTEWKM